LDALILRSFDNAGGSRAWDEGRSFLDHDRPNHGLQLFHSEGDSCLSAWNSHSIGAVQHIDRWHDRPVFLTDYPTSVMTDGHRVGPLRRQNLKLTMS
jgi:hypothetical protein